MSEPLDPEAAFHALAAVAAAAGPGAASYPELEEALASALAVHHGLVVARRRRPLSVPAGLAAEEPEAPTGPVHLVPAPGAVPGLDEAKAGVFVFRTVAPGTVLGRAVPAGARVLLSRRTPEPGDAYVVRSKDGLCVAPPAAGDHVLGVVEAVIA